MYKDMKIIKTLILFLVIFVILRIVIITVAFDSRIFPCVVTPFVAPTSVPPESHNDLCGFGTWVGSSQVLTKQGNLMKIALSDVFPILIASGLTYLWYKRKKNVV